MRWLFFAFVVVLSQIQKLQTADLNPSATSTESTITVRWNVINLSDSMYLLKHHRTGGIFVTDQYFHGPFNEPKLEYTIQKLYPGVNYTYIIFRNSNTSQGRMFSQTISTVPLPPVSVEVADRGSTWLNLAWEPGHNSSQTSHKIMYTDDDDTGSQTATGSYETVFNLTQLLPGHRYTVRVSAVAGDKMSNSSEPLKTLTAPGAPANLSVNAANTTHLQVTWSSGENSFQDGYFVKYVEYGKSSEADATCGMGSSCLFAPGSLPGQLYSIRVYAHRENVTGSPAIKEHNTRPKPVENLDGTSGVRNVEVTWSPPQHSAYESFKIRLQNTLTSIHEDFTVGKDNYRFSDHNVRGGASYNIYVYSSTQTEDSTPHTKLLLTIPEPVTDLRGEAVNTTAIAMSWVLPRNSDFDNVRVIITKPTAEKINITLSKDVQHYTVINLLAGEIYDIAVLVMAKVHESSPLSGQFRTKPHSPEIRSVVPAETSVTVNLSPQVEGTLDFYRTYIEGRENEQRNVTIDSPTTLFEGLSEGTLYTVRAFSVSGNQDSDPASKKFHTKPRPPSSLTVAAYNSTTVQVSWGVPDRGKHNNYTVSIVPSNGESQPEGIQTADLTWTFEKAEAGQTYNVSVYTNLGSEQSAAAFKQVTTNPNSVATLQKAGANTTGIYVNWTSPANTVHFDFYYLTIEPKDGPTPNITRGHNERSFWFVGLRSGQRYNITITTVKQRGQNFILGVPTSIIAVTNPLPVEFIAVESVDTEKLAVKWNISSISQQDFFIITYSTNGQSKKTRVDAVGEKSDYEKTLEALLSGYTYEVTIEAVRSDAQDSESSEAQQGSGTTAPMAVQDLTPFVQGQTLRLTWNTTTSSKQDYFIIKHRPVLRNASSHYVENNATAKDIELLQLFPGERYQVFVYAISQGIISEHKQTTAVIAPLAPKSITPVKDKTTTSSLTFSWKYVTSETYVEMWVIKYSNDTSMAEQNVLADVSNTNVEYKISDLRPGAAYNVEVKSVVQTKSSLAVLANATVKPVLETSLTERSGTTNETILFQYTVEEGDIFKKIRFILLNSSNILPVFKDKSDPNKVVSFGGLVGGTSYTVEVVTLSGDEVSDPQYISIRTVPNAVRMSHQSTENSVIINFGGLSGNADLYVVHCLNQGSSCWNKQYPASTSSITISNLKPYTSYNISVTTVAGEKSKSASFSFKTNQAAPSPVRSVTLREDSLRTLVVSWLPPKEMNGVLQKYLLTYSGYDPTVSTSVFDNGTYIVDKGLTEHTLERLKAGYYYNVKVQAETVALGKAGSNTITLRTDKPTFKSEFNSESAKPTKPPSSEDSVVTETQLKVTFINAFSGDNGRIIAYTVLVAKDSLRGDSAQTRLPSWNDANKDSSIRVYQTIGNCTDFFSEISTCGVSSRKKRATSGGELKYKVFTVGAEKNCAEKDYCNGPLHAETDYYMKLRAFTSSGYTDTAYSKMIRTAAPKTNVGGIIGGVFAAIIVLVIIAVVVFLWHRRRPKPAQKYQGDRTDWEQSSMNKFTRPVKLAEYKEHVQKMAADSDFRYAEEYEDLKEVGRDQSTIAAEFPPNRPKNRFTNILPYDHSRVKLLPTDDEEGSDYINANYIPGYMSKREYIATQGPLPSTRDDFWRMVWEQNVRNIVMLTKCMEKGREKSDHYWPSDPEPKFYGDLQVCILNETHLPDWTITEFKMSLGDTARQIRHFHYKAWPDFGVPKNPTSLIRFVRTVREKLIREGGAIVAHCSAGVGRSGTFIVLDHCLQHIKEHDYVDVYSIVYKLRKERVLMVQTEQQYKFIHECILCVLEGREDEATYANVGHVNIGFDDDEGINVEAPGL